MTFYYPAIVKKTEEKYRVDFLDLDQCYGEGETEEDALEDARDNAVNWILTEMADNIDLPMQTVMGDVTLNKGERFTMIQIIMPREGWDE